MLELAHKLADSDAKFFGGWVLAGAEAHIHQPAEAMDNHPCSGNCGRWQSG